MSTQADEQILNFYKSDTTHEDRVRLILAGDDNATPTDILYANFIACIPENAQPSVTLKAIGKMAATSLFAINGNDPDMVNIGTRVLAEAINRQLKAHRAELAERRKWS